MDALLIEKFQILKKWKFKLLECAWCVYSKEAHSNHGHSAAIEKNIRVCWIKKLSKKLQIWCAVTVVQMRFFWIPIKFDGLQPIFIHTKKKYFHPPDSIPEVHRSSATPIINKLHGYKNCICMQFFGLIGQIGGVCNLTCNFWVHASMPIWVSFNSYELQDGRWATKLPQPSLV